MSVSRATFETSNGNLSTITSQPLEVTLNNIRDITARLPLHASAILKALTQLRMGAITVQLPTGKAYHFDSGTEGPDASVVLHSWNAPRKVLTGGSIGLAESYMAREWDSDDVTTFLELFSVNEALGDELTTPSWFASFVHKFRHWMNENTRRGSKRNISAHYDLGNEFYSLWLDKSMTYSSALFGSRTNSLESAQDAKYQSLIDGAGIKPGDHVLEIGCGWGGFAEYAAKNAGAKVTGLTISREQLDFARKRIFEAGLNDRVEFKFQDYRDETGVYDKVASIEMFEAVGEKYWGTYFSKVRDCLKTGGKAGLQIITIADRSFEKYRSRPDFIQHYIFPGGMLPSPVRLSELAQEHDFAEEPPVVFGHDYARTLAEWRDRFWQSWEDVRKLGFDDRFKRLWEFYLYYCEAGFRSENIDVRQVFYRKA